MYLDYYKAIVKATDDADGVGKEEVRLHVRLYVLILTTIRWTPDMAKERARKYIPLSIAMYALMYLESPFRAIRAPLRRARRAKKRWPTRPER